MITPEEREQRKADRDAEQKARVAEYVAQVVADVPPLTDRQKDAIRAAFAGFTRDSRADRLAERFQVRDDNLSVLRRASHAR